MDRLPSIRETIVVEGKDDVAAVKRACQAQTIITNGLGLSQATIEDIRIAKQQCGVIILTDPDAAGEKIRHRINRLVPGCKQAYIPWDRSEKTRPVGVEYAQPQVILDALREAKASAAEASHTFDLADLVALGLSGGDGARTKRDWLSQRLGIGLPNGKQFLRRLNAYNISREAFMGAYQEMIDRDG